MMTFVKGQMIDGRYSVLFPLCQDGYSEIYRVRGPEGGLHFLTLYRHDLLPDGAVGDGGELKIITMRRGISHPNVCAFEDAGSFDLSPERFSYFVTRFVSTETLADRLRRTPPLGVRDARQLVLALLRTLRVLHTLPRPVVHGRIETSRILLDLTGTFSDFKLTGFAIPCDEVTEADIKADLRAVGALLYRLCFGVDAEQPPRLPNVLPAGVDQQLIAVIAKALGNSGFDSAETMIKALTGVDGIDLASPEIAAFSGIGTATTPSRKGNGFADVAGMDELKTLLNESVLYVLRDRERAKRYNLDIPNGMLLYGPPGCGKTFIAERFAEEAGYNYRFVKSSDLASTYIHGTQEKIGMLFDEARSKAPTVLCFDEFEALASKRTEHHNANLSGEVNELLSQLNNCGKDQVFVIATTNQPDLIDPAVLRRGRMDHIIYVPMPDEAAREGMFRIYLDNRPCGSDIDFCRLARLTKDYVASEIAFVCNQAALIASRSDSDISQSLLESIIGQTKPRTTRDSQQYYENMKIRMENIQEERRPIGFRTQQ